MGEALFDRVTQVWVRLTGRRVRLDSDSWLEGPIGEVDVIGEKFFHRYAEREGLLLDEATQVRGLLPSIANLDGPHFETARLQRGVVDFYEETSKYSFEVSPRANTLLRPFVWLIALLFSRRLRQLNVPRSSKEARGGATSEVFFVRRGGEHLFSAWIRTLVSTGNTLYAGAYSTTTVPGHSSPCVKVVFPLPNGNASVLMRPELQDDGSLLLRSEGKRFGDPGFYFYVRENAEGGFAKYVRSLRETIHVFPGEASEVRATHEVTFFGISVFRQDYRMRS